MKTRNRFYVSCLLAAALSLGLAPRPARADTQSQLQQQLNQIMAQGAKGAVGGMAGQLDWLIQSEKTGNQAHDAMLDLAQTGIGIIDQLIQMLIDKISGGNGSSADDQLLQQLQNQLDGLQNGNFGNNPSSPGTGTPGTGTPGTPGSGTPGTPGTGTPGTPGTGTPGAPGTGTPGAPGTGGTGSGGLGGFGNSGNPGGLSGSGLNGGTGANGAGANGASSPIASAVTDPTGTGAIGNSADPYGSSYGGSPSYGGGYGGGGYGGGGYGGGFGGGGGDFGGPGGLGGVGGSTGSGGGGGGGGGGVGGSGGAGGAGAAAAAALQQVRGRLVLVPRSAPAQAGAKKAPPKVDMAGAPKADLDKMTKLTSKLKDGDLVSEALVRVEAIVMGWRRAKKAGRPTKPTNSAEADELGDNPTFRDHDGKLDLSRFDAWIVSDWTSATPKRYQLRVKDLKDLKESKPGEVGPGTYLSVRGNVTPLSNVPAEFKSELGGDVSTVDAVEVTVAKEPEEASPGPATTTGPSATPPQPGKTSAPQGPQGARAPNAPKQPSSKPGSKPATPSDDDDFKD